LQRRFHSIQALAAATGGSMLIMKIEDDGAGFENSGRFAHSFGLSAMKHWVEALGGRIEIQSKPTGLASTSLASGSYLPLPRGGGSDV
jgi:signal transduction histidine kinase